MIPLDRCAGLLLCAGLSRRFGPANKLLAPLGGRPLVAGAADLCASAPFAQRLAVVGPGEPVLREHLQRAGLGLVENRTPEEGRDRSLRLGLEALSESAIDGVVILLGDMPHVTLEHLTALAAVAGPETAAISYDGEAAMPPTLIPAGLIGHILAEPNISVRQLLGEPARVPAPAAMLADYDTPDRFAE